MKMCSIKILNACVQNFWIAKIRIEFTLSETERGLQHDKKERRHAVIFMGEKYCNAYTLYENVTN